MKTAYFIPKHKYKPVSLTGSWCALSCKFCNRKYIENMVHTTPSSFTDIIAQLYSEGVRGVLLSGGFRRDASLPIEPYIEPLRMVRKTFNLVISAHLGLTRNKELLGELKDLIDVVDFEFTLNPYIVNETRMLHTSPSTYVEVLKHMLDAGLRVVPHVFAWHPGFNPEVFRAELKALSDLGIGEATFLVYIDPAAWEEAARISRSVVENVELARSVFPGKIYMGCMRPWYVKPLADQALVEKELVDRIANPYHKVMNANPGEAYDACCSIPLSADTEKIFRVKQ